MIQAVRYKADSSAKPPPGKLVVYHIPVCPFSQRLEILMNLKGLHEMVSFQVVDVTRPFPERLLEQTHGNTELPVLETEEGGLIRESLVILRYLDARFAEPAIAQREPYSRAIEDMLCLMAADFSTHGYRYVMNQDKQLREKFRMGMLERYARTNVFLKTYASSGPYLFDDFGMAETVYTPLFMRFWFLEYYENFNLPREGRFARVRQWQEACLAHPAAQQVRKEQIVKLYYDYAKGASNGELLPGRNRSSFIAEPYWQDRPWPPADKFMVSATDRALGLLA